MASVEDYRTLTPTWLLVLRCLDEAPALGLDLEGSGAVLLTNVARDVFRRSGGRVGWSLGTLRKMVLRMTEDGLVELARVTKSKRARRYTTPPRELTGYRLTADGRAFVFEALEETRVALGL